MKKITSTALAVALMVVGGSAVAQTVSVSNTNAIINSSHVSTVTLTRGGQPVEGFEFEMTYVNADLGLATSPSPHPNVTPSVGGFACAVSTVGRLRCVGTPAAPIPETITIAVQFTVGPNAVPAPGSPLVIENVLFIDGSANTIATTNTNGSVIIGTAPPDVTLAFTPAPGATVTFPGGTAFTTSNTSIAVAAGGNVGSGTVTGCTITGAGAAAFGTPPADITVAAGASGSLPLSCTLPNTGGAATATLTCTETDSNSAGVARTWPLSCPQGTPVPGPGFGASPAPNPAPAAPILCNSQAGDSVQRQITITNNGNAGAGSALDFTCTGGGIVSIVSGGTATGLAVGASQTVTVACAVPGDGVTSTGTVSCTSNAPGGPFVFNYSSTGSTFPPPVPRPAVVPASSTWSQIALIALLAGLGLAFVGFRRGQ